MKQNALLPIPDNINYTPYPKRPEEEYITYLVFDMDGNKKVKLYVGKLAESELNSYISTEFYLPAIKSLKVDCIMYYKHELTVAISQSTPEDY